MDFVTCQDRLAHSVAGAQILSNVAGLRNEQGVDQKVRGLQGVPSRLGQVHAYQTISSSRALSAMLKNQ
jgi:hypothetical protein